MVDKMQRIEMSYWTGWNAMIVDIVYLNLIIDCQWPICCNAEVAVTLTRVPCDDLITL